MGYQVAISWFSKQKPVKESKDKHKTSFTFDDIFCLVNNNGAINATFKIKKVKDGTYFTSNTLQLATILFCGPLKNTCPIVERYNFLKRVCFEELGHIVFQCPYSDRLYVARSGYLYSTFDTVCNNDPNFYQSCGIKNSLTLSNSAAICNEYVCAVKENVVIPTILEGTMSVVAVSSAWMCDQAADLPLSQTCSNLPNNLCSAENEGDDILFQLTLRSGLTVGKSSICNGRCEKNGARTRLSVVVTYTVCTALTGNKHSNTSNQVKCAMGT